MNRRVVQGLLALIATVTMISIPAPASAGKPWTTALCTSGTLDEASLSQITVDTFLTLEGHLDCGLLEDGEGSFAYARYVPGGLAGQLRQRDLREYAATRPTPFADTMKIEWMPEAAYCVVTAPTTRVACVKVTRDAPAYAPVLEPLAVDDPLVSIPAKLVTDDQWGNDPMCGGCW